jgi:hypothetical protein
MATNGRKGRRLYSDVHFVVKCYWLITNAGYAPLSEGVCLTFDVRQLTLYAPSHPTHAGEHVSLVLLHCSYQRKLYRGACSVILRWCLQALLGTQLLFIEVVTLTQRPSMVAQNS